MEKQELPAPTGDPDYWRWLVEKARAGDPSAARDILHACCSSIEQDRDLPKPIKDFIYLAFTGYLARFTKGNQEPKRGELEKALFLNRRGGREPELIKIVPIRICRNIKTPNVPGIHSDWKPAPKDRGIRQVIRKFDRNSVWIVAMLRYYMKRYGADRNAAIRELESKFGVMRDNIDNYDKWHSDIQNLSLTELKQLIRDSRFI